MNAAAGKKTDGSSFLALILEPGNLHRLKSDQPISVRVEDYFPDGIPRRLQLIIGHSGTPISDARKLAETAEVTLDERTPKTKERRPHCSECKSTIEQMGCWRADGVPWVILYCPVCGCVFGVAPRVDVGSIDKP